MADSETVLLQRFVQGGDPVAFGEIVRRHASLVYGTCLRVLSDADQAADATQETFFQLVKKADEVTGSVSGWLHRVAIGKAVDLIRSDTRRRHREQEYADTRSMCDASWREVCPHVDEALNRLDDQTREILVQHFLEGQSMTSLAADLGVSRPTVSRRLEAGLTKLRRGLHQRGVVITVVGLSSLLAENAAQSAPLSLLRDIAKVSLVGANGGAVSGSGALVGGVMAAAKTKLVVATAAAVVIGVGLLTYRGLSSRPPQSPVSPPVVPGSHRSGRPASNGPKPVRPPAIEEEAVQQETPSQPVAEEVSTLPPASVSEEPLFEWPDTSASSGSAEGSGFELDLSSPEATVRSFTKAFVLGDAESALACWFTTAGDYPIIQQALDAGPDDPQEMYEGKLWFQSLDPDAEMPVVRTEDIEGGIILAWRVTLKKDVTMGGQTYRAGDTEEIEVTVRPSGDSWLIDNM